MKKNPCTKMVTKYTFWRNKPYQEEVTEHDWAYYNPQKRKCEKCGAIEIMTSVSYTCDGVPCGPQEHWKKGLE